MKTEKLIKFLEEDADLYDAFEAEMMIEIIDRLKELDRLRKLYGMSDDRGN